ncbi:TetR family transcriptional regulator [Kineosporia succinea]|uniref:AcrR family transcriptional regulator n=1 Tax=Kineosporia succinea TaxID=84632 RepID=A0ABT9P112_9ACTN|nr:TetR family transcriptional regulator [Kineosporia succinea]MDP9826202.1 AcrR family transcriptional regulator [Kineosporia succinea]
MNGVVEKRPGARELARRAMKAQVSQMAFDLFVDRGYEETTVDDICEVAGISRSTFFRYFPTKEDVLLSQGTNTVDRVLVALKERPDDESAWNALRQAMKPAIEQYDDGSERRLSLHRLLTATPVLAAHQQQNKLSEWHAVLGPELARRLGGEPDDPSDPASLALVAAALGCLDAALRAWAASADPRPLAEILDQALSAIR